MTGSGPFISLWTPPPEYAKDSLVYTNADALLAWCLQRLSEW